MSRPEPSFDDEKPPPWMGAPGYSPVPEQFPPHAPMPGAPPYPDTPPPAPAAAPTRTRFGRVVVAAAAWGVVGLVLASLVSGPADAAAGRRLAIVVLVPTLLSGLITWLVARSRAWAFPVLVLVAAPTFWLLYGVMTLLHG